MTPWRKLPHFRFSGRQKSAEMLAFSGTDQGCGAKSWQILAGFVLNSLI
jgi:hypothetical protein